jgi:hypothetical protein
MTKIQEIVRVGEREIGSSEVHQVHEVQEVHEVHRFKGSWRFSLNPMNTMNLRTQ